MKTLRASRVAGYVIVGSGIDPKIDSPTLFQDIQAWVMWLKANAAYQLEGIAADKLEADEAILPAVIVNSKPHWPAWWKLKTWVLNLPRKRVNAEFREREARYFSEQVVAARRKASQS